MFVILFGKKTGNKNPERKKRMKCWQEDRVFRSATPRREQCSEERRT